MLCPHAVPYAILGEKIRLLQQHTTLTLCCYVTQRKRFLWWHATPSCCTVYLSYHIGEKLEKRRFYSSKQSLCTMPYIKHQWRKEGIYGLVLCHIKGIGEKKFFYSGQQPPCTMPYEYIKKEKEEKQTMSTCTVCMSERDPLQFCCLPYIIKKRFLQVQLCKTPSGYAVHSYKKGERSMAMHGPLALCHT